MKNQGYCTQPSDWNSSKIKKEHKSHDMYILCMWVVYRNKIATLTCIHKGHTKSFIYRMCTGIPPVLYTTSFFILPVLYPGTSTSSTSTVCLGWTKTFQAWQVYNSSEILKQYTCVPIPTNISLCVTWMYTINAGPSSKHRRARPSLFLSFPPFVWFFLAKVTLEEQPSLAQQ